MVDNNLEEKYDSLKRTTIMLGTILAITLILFTIGFYKGWFGAPKQLYFSPQSDIDNLQKKVDAKCQEKTSAAAEMEGAADAYEAAFQTAYSAAGTSKAAEAQAQAEKSFAAYQATIEKYNKVFEEKTALEVQLALMKAQLSAAQFWEEYDKIKEADKAKHEGNAGTGTTAHN